jgi:hypothetical protein
MPYTIKKFNGQTIAIIQDGSVDNISTDLNLPGKNYSGYGKSLNESLVYLLENFANSVEPSNKITGQLWFDTSVKKIKIYNGVEFKPLGTIEHSATAPTGQLAGDLWFNTTTSQLFAYNGTEHKLIGPLLVNPNAAQLVSKVLIDTGGNRHTVLASQFEDTITTIFSKDEFDIDSTQTPVTGFGKIFKGVTLPSRTNYPNIKFGGMAKTSESLLVNNVEIPAANFVQNTGTGNQIMNTSLSIRVEPSLNSNGTFSNVKGLFLGSSDNFFLGYNAGTAYLNNITGSNFSLGVTVSGELRKVVAIDNTGLIPDTDSAFSLGTTTRKIKNVFASNFVAVDDATLPAGNAAFRGKVEGTSVSASAGFVGRLVGNVNGNIVKADNTEVLTIGGLTPVFNGRTNGSHYGNIVNLSAPVDQQIAVDVNGATTIFRGAFSGVSETASKIRIGNTDYSGLVSSVNPTPYRNTVAVRDADGNLSAVQFLGTAQQSISILDQNQVPRVASISNTPFTIVVRDSNGAIQVGNIAGTATNSDRLGGLVPSVLNTPSTIVARDSAADIFVNIVHGTATSANYADLAEKYLTDTEYDVGTVVKIGGEKEVTASTWGCRAIGVVSANPAYMMNSGLEGGTYIALKGRVPVKVVGRIKKGEDLIASDNGYAVMAVPHASRVFAVALETSDDEGPKVIEALIL